MKREAGSQRPVPPVVVESGRIQTGKRNVLRLSLAVIGILGGIAYGGHLVGNLFFPVISGFVFFLAITDFGRQCPLLLSLRSTLFPSKYRRIPPTS